jgi:hypothetical protein
MEKKNKPNSATQAKKRWNQRNYTQIKAHIEPELASSFKAACAASGISIASVLTQFMSEYTKSGKKRGAQPDYPTRRQRRAALKSCTLQIDAIREAEERSRDNTPENLQGSANYEQADEYVSQLEEVVDLLSNIY